LTVPIGLAQFDLNLKIFFFFLKDLLASLLACLLGQPVSHIRQQDLCQIVEAIMTSLQCVEHNEKFFCFSYFFS
jgi:hypothetical protein